MSQTFSKVERISKKKDIEELFSKGSSFYLYPFSVRFQSMENEEEIPNAVLISASKRNFKKAVDRNLLKRRIREAYRLNKTLLPILGFKIGLVYSSKKIHDFSFIQNKLIKVLQRLKDEKA